MKTEDIHPPVYGRKRHPWRWGVAHTRLIGERPRTWITSEHSSKEQAEKCLAVELKRRSSERVANRGIDDRLLEPTEPAPVFRTREDAIAASPLQPQTLYSFECPVCGTDFADAHGGYSCADHETVLELYEEHLSDHGIPGADDLATCKHCLKEFDVSIGKTRCESFAECEPDD